MNPVCRVCYMPQQMCCTCSVVCVKCREANGKPCVCCAYRASVAKSGQVPQKSCLPRYDAVFWAGKQALDEIDAEIPKPKPTAPRLPATPTTPPQPAVPTYIVGALILGWLLVFACMWVVSQ